MFLPKHHRVRRSNRRSVRRRRPPPSDFWPPDFSFCVSDWCRVRSLKKSRQNANEALFMQAMIRADADSSHCIRFLKQKKKTLENKQRRKTVDLSLKMTTVAVSYGRRANSLQLTPASSRTSVRHYLMTRRHQRVK